MYQKSIIVGHLGNDPQTFHAQYGQTVTLFSVKAERSWNNEDGSQGKQTLWFQVSAWGKLGETCQQVLGKGRRVLVEGYLIADANTGGPRIQIDGKGRPVTWFEIGADIVKLLDIYDHLIEGGEAKTTVSSVDESDYGVLRCPTCGATMLYSYTDEHLNEHIWECPNCGHTRGFGLTEQEMQERGDYSYLEDWDSGPGSDWD